eukprot:scaffold17629_cov38-Phaeocystis_antarctica.AAC.3
MAGSNEALRYVSYPTQVRPLAWLGLGLGLGSPTRRRYASHPPPPLTLAAAVPPRATLYSSALSAHRRP